MIQLMEKEQTTDDSSTKELDYEYNIGTVYTQKQKDVLWEDFVSRSDQFQKKIREIVREMALRQETVVLNKLNRLQELRSAGQILFDKKDENYQLARQLRPYLSSIMRSEGQMQLDRVRILTKGYKDLEEKQPDDFEMDVEIISDYLADLETLYADEINNTTRKEIIEVVNEGMKEGLTNAQISRSITDIYGALRTYRADTIARLHSMQVMSIADWAAYRQSGVVVERSWLSARDGRVRDTHSEADGQVKELGKSFNVGGVNLRMPRDPAGPLDEVLGCRCTTLPITINMKEQINAITTKNLDILAENVMKELENKLEKKRLEELKEKREAVEEVKEAVKKEMIDEAGKIIEETSEVREQMQKQLEKEEENIEADAREKRAEQEAIAKAEQEELEKRKDKLVESVEAETEKLKNIDQERVKKMDEIESKANAKKEKIIEEHKSLQERLQTGYDRLRGKFKDLRSKISNEEDKLQKAKLETSVKELEEEYEERKSLIERASDRAKEILNIARRDAKEEKDEELKEVKEIKGKLEKKLEEQKQKEREEINEVYKKYKSTVNMSRSELEAWSKTECSKLASKDRSPIKRNLRLLGKKKSEWTKRDMKDANRTISFISRMRGNERGEDVEDSNGNSCGSKRDISLKNWAYDPGK
jgi:hypothetical protein